MKTSKFAIGAILGAAAGVVAGILTAPKSGRETRADIKQKAGEVLDRAADTKDDVFIKFDDVIESIKTALKKKD